MGAKRVKIGEKPQMTAESRLPELPPQSHSEQIAPIKPPMSVSHRSTKGQPSNH
jgi:hypothetical protein